MNVLVTQGKIIRVGLSDFAGRDIAVVDEAVTALSSARGSAPRQTGFNRGYRKASKWQPVRTGVAESTRYASG